MKITPQGLERYKTVVQNVKNSENASKNKALGNVSGRADKVTLSEEATAHAELARFVSSLGNEVENSASPQRVEELREAVQNGSYHVPTADIADAILNRKV